MKKMNFFNRTMLLFAALVMTSGSMSDVIKVGCVGDSNTYGSGSDNRIKYAWPVQIRNMLGKSYETKNFGVNGAYMMDHLTLSWKNTAAYNDNKLYDPDIIVIALGTNDSQGAYWDAGKFKNSYISLINEFKNYPANPEIYMALPIKAYSSTGGTNDQTIREKIIPVMKEISTEKGLPLIDLYAVTDNIANLMRPDGIHPNDEGLKIMARKVADIMLLEKPVIEMNSSTITNTYAEYHWYKDNVLINGANAVSYTATGTGSYKVAVKLTATTNDVIVSEPVEVTQTGTVLSASNYPMSVSTPEINKLTVVPLADGIRVTNGAGSILSFYDIDGRAVAECKVNGEEEVIGTSFLTKGLYICRGRQGDTIVTVKILK